MKLTLTEKTDLNSVMRRLEKTLAKLKFSSTESLAAEETLKKYHSILTSSGSEKFSSRFEKTITADNGNKITIIGLSSSQQGFFAKLFGS